MADTLHLCTLDRQADGAHGMSGKRPVHASLKPGKAAQMFPRGISRTVDGEKVRCEAEDFRFLETDFATRVNPLTLTYEHGKDQAKGRKGAGEGTRLETREDGQWLTDPAWTDEALEEIRSGARSWISPTFYAVRDEEGFLRPRAYRDASLTSVPNLDGMERVAASAAPGTGTPSPATATEEKEIEMKFTKEELAQRGLKEDATEDQIRAAFLKPAAAPAPPPPVVPPPPAPATAVDMTALATMAAGIVVKELASSTRIQVEAIAKDQEHTRRVDEIVGKYVGSGQILVAETSAAGVKERTGFAAFAAADPNGAEKFAAALPVRAPVSSTIDTSPIAVDLIAASAQTMDEKAKEHMKKMAAAGTPVGYVAALRAVTPAKK